MNIELFKKRFHTAFDELSSDDLKSNLEKLGYDFINDEIFNSNEFIQNKDYYITTVPVNKVNFDKVVFKDTQDDMLLSA